MLCEELLDAEVRNLGVTLMCLLASPTPQPSCPVNPAASSSAMSPQAPSPSAASSFVWALRPSLQPTYLMPRPLSGTTAMLASAQLGHSGCRPPRAPRRLQGWAQKPREDSLPSDLLPPLACPEVAPCLACWATGAVPPHP